MMFALKKHITRMEREINEKFSYMIYHHSILGLITIFVGIPAATFALVCGSTSFVLALVSVLCGLF